jgi:hypothetical protein
MTVDQLAARIRRLERLAMGLRKEHQSDGQQGAPWTLSHRAPPREEVTAAMMTSLFGAW